MKDCTCKDCVEICANGNPGWFAPGEAEKAAALLGIPFEEFRKNLIQDYWCGDALDDDVYVLAPRKEGIETDREIASWGYPFSRGRCVFLTPENRCCIHAAKPLECKRTFACRKDGSGNRKAIALLWNNSSNSGAER